MDRINDNYAVWCEKASLYKADLDSMSDEDKKEAFYKDLEFGTAGLRGILGAGTNRLNVYTIGKVTKGLALYLLAHKKSGVTVAISYDSRNCSEEFARYAAAVLAECGIKAYITDKLQPTPYLSYMVRSLKCDAGIMITASHNPAKFNGYKVYGADGCQVTDNAATEIFSFIEGVDTFSVRPADFDKAVASGAIEFADVTRAYLDEVYKRSVGAARNVSVVYTPLNGTGASIVPQMFRERGFNNVTIVPEQAMPDGNFPTTPYPNPEKAEALRLAVELAKKTGADIVIGTDPDADRIGAAVKTGDGYRLISGNEMGVLLIDYIFSHAKALPKNPVVVKTIVTTDLAARVAERCGAEVREVLTGFKYIGEVIKKLEQKGEGDRFVFGYEESYGYLSGTYVRDKDAVVASMLVAEMAADYLKEGKTLADVLDGIYSEFGKYYHRTVSFTYEGAAGAQKMREVLASVRNNPPAEIDGSAVVESIDYLTQTKFDLPKSNVLSFKAADGSKLIVRPSGTEPLIKVYITAASGGEQRIDAILDQVKKFM
ncbi:phospho-sugar mutase [Anaerocaecibacter muris]|uniref:phospho-sugar mutase n=1 Tax=Anaerocaecibacter muris TaxID=2941513 RepID=UPI002040B786|nr:phospho-sugar mutase [Anaerocaecibacter muris]